MSKCFLCVCMNWDEDKKIPVFAGYSMYSAEPWNVTNIGLVNAALYVTESEVGYHEAQKQMCETVKRLAELLPGSFWTTVWKWIDPSPEAHEERYKLFLEARNGGEPCR